MVLSASLQAQQFSTNGNTNLSTNARSAYISGTNNLIELGVTNAFLGAGQQNIIQQGANWSSLSSGRANIIGSNVSYAHLGGGFSNRVVVGSAFSSLSGGMLNNISNASYAFVGSGYSNSISGRYSSIVGGQENSVSGRFSTITGGLSNRVDGTNAFIVGGALNTVAGIYAGIVSGYGGSASGNYSVVLGGFSNRASGAYSTVMGGQLVEALGTYAFAGGRRAKATNNGAFVWADSQNADFASTRTNQFLIRASGGVGINTNNPGTNSLSVRGRAQISGDLQVTGQIFGNLSTSNADLNSVSASNSFSIQTAGTTAWFASAQATSFSPYFLTNFNGRNIVAGYSSNSVAAGVIGATIAGGGGVEIGFATGYNQVTANFGTIGGGYGNWAQGEFSFVGGGDQNKATALYAAAVGGFNNQASGVNSFLGGGDRNAASGTKSVIAGGQENMVLRDASEGTIGGGLSNTVAGVRGAVGGGYYNEAGGAYSAVPGGSNNVAAGVGSFAAGVNARALHDYSFVWGGSPNVDTVSTTNGEFAVRSPGGAKFITSTNDVGVMLPTNGTAWSSISDSNAKTDVTAIDHRETLRKVAALPVTTWNYKHDPKRRYIGPMAQDFHAAFGLGHDDKHISTLDTDGVTLSAIKGLVEELREQASRLAELEAELQALREEVGGNLPPAE
jgi:trimeric autotransporter adhesin